MSKRTIADIRRADKARERMEWMRKSYGLRSGQAAGLLGKTRHAADARKRK